MCTNVLFLKILYFSLVVLSIVRYIVPIGLIVRIIIDLFRGMVSGNSISPKEIIVKDLEKVVAAIIVFLVPTFVSLFVTLIENTVLVSVDYQNCIPNAYNYAYYEKIEELKLTEKLRERELERYNMLKNQEKNQIKNNIDNSIDSETTSGNNAKEVGKKYNLSPIELENIAKICQKEQGTARGAAIEASLMANRYELEKLKNSKWASRSFYDYVLNCGWWAPANKRNFYNVNLASGVLNNVRDVLINGQRHLPLYVDEHDWTGDLTKIVTNGRTLTTRTAFNNHANYVTNKTQIYNRMGAVYTYYTHAHEKGDPFGYTSASKKRIEGLSN